jgi:V/A-type H+/Na+-transporting ATPase subunit F
MDNIIVVGYDDFVLGFRLAGIKHIVEIDRYEEPKERLMKVMDDKSNGIVVFQQEVFNKLSEWDRFAIEESIKPLAVVLSTQAEQDSLRKMIIRSIGVDLLGQK